MTAVHNALLTRTKCLNTSLQSCSGMYCVLLAFDVKECACAISNEHFTSHFSQHDAGENIHSHIQ